jgi:VanZ family protein
MQRQQSRLLNYILHAGAPLIAIAIFILSCQSRLPVIPGIFGIDKVQHSCAYLGLSFFLIVWTWGWAERRAHGSRQKLFLCAWLLAAVLSSAYGATDEFHQYFVPGRDCSIFDWFADTGGSLAGSAIACALAFFYRFRYDTQKE